MTSKKMKETALRLFIYQVQQFDLTCKDLHCNASDIAQALDVPTDEWVAFVDSVVCGSLDELENMRAQELAFGWLKFSLKENGVRFHPHQAEFLTEFMSDALAISRAEAKNFQGLLAQELIHDVFFSGEEILEREE